MRGDSERRADELKVLVDREAERSGTLENFLRGMWERSERDGPPFNNADERNKAND